MVQNPAGRRSNISDITEIEKEPVMLQVRDMDRKQLTFAMREKIRDRYQEGNLARLSVNVTNSCEIKRLRVGYIRFVLSVVAVISHRRLRASGFTEKLLSFLPQAS